MRTALLIDMNELGKVADNAEFRVHDSESALNGRPLPMYVVFVFGKIEAKNVAVGRKVAIQRGPHIPALVDISPPLGTSHA